MAVRILTLPPWKASLGTKSCYVELEIGYNSSKDTQGDRIFFASIIVRKIIRGNSS